MVDAEQTRQSSSNNIESSDDVDRCTKDDRVDPTMADEADWGTIESNRVDIDVGKHRHTQSSQFWPHVVSIILVCAGIGVHTLHGLVALDD